MNRIAKRILAEEKWYQFNDFNKAKEVAIQLSKEENVDYIVYMPGFEREIYEIDRAPNGQTDIPGTYICYFTGDEANRKKAA